MSSLIKKWRRSGLSKRVFCSKEQISLHTFNYWIDKERGVLPSSGFIEVTASCSSQESSKDKEIPNAKVVLRDREGLLEISFPQGAILRLSHSMNQADLQLVKTLLY